MILYLHLGQDTIISSSEIIGIFDLDTASLSKYTRKYLANEEKSGRVINVTNELPKSFVVCVDKAGKSKLYITQVSSATLRRRACGESFITK